MKLSFLSLNGYMLSAPTQHNMFRQQINTSLSWNCLPARIHPRHSDSLPQNMSLFPFSLVFCVLALLLVLVYGKRSVVRDVGPDSFFDKLNSYLPSPLYALRFMHML